MKEIFLIALVMGLLIGCQSTESSKTADADYHTVIVLETINTSSYTYLRVKEGNIENWLAVPLMNAVVGETYYYDADMLVTNFKSKELDRVFETIYFLDGLSTMPPGTENTALGDKPAHLGSSAVAVDKENIKIEPAKGGITVADLFEKKESYSGKNIKIKGLVIKFSPGIMGKNWIHIQDGTDFNGKFDLTITSNADVYIGDIVTLEGKISLNKDFGAGYVYEVIMEDAVIK
jgi:hypothetical protein